MPAANAPLRMWFAVVLVVSQLALQAPHRLASPVQGPPAPPHALLSPAANQALRISQIYGGGANGKTYPWDFVELFSTSEASISLDGWSLQIASATGSWASFSLAGKSTPAHGYFLVASGSGTGSAPVTPDLRKSFSLNSGGGKVRLVYTVSGASTVMDLVGYGNANEFETTAAPAFNDETAAFRLDGGCTDEDNNRTDFMIAPPAARNAASATHDCESTPAVSSTPANDATSVARNANLIVTFDEPVTVSGEWFEVRCDLSGMRNSQTATVEMTDDRQTYTINPEGDFFGDDNCRMTVFAAAVSDDDLNDPPDHPTADYTASFRTVAGGCGEPAYSIGGVQGTSASSPAASKWRTVEGVVTGAFQGADKLAGFFLQEEPADADESQQTSEAIFVDEHAASLGDVATSTWLRVTGVVTESSGLTSLTNVSNIARCGTAALPPAAQIALPLSPTETWEQYESMLVQFPQQLTVSDSAALGSQGQLRLVASGLARAYTQAHMPDASGFRSWETDLAARAVVLDDGSAAPYPDPIRYPSPGLSASNTVRAGDVVEAGLTGIADFRGGQNVVQPTGEPGFSRQDRPAAPPRPATGNVRAAFMSLHDYFKVTGATGHARGASSAEEYTRQRDKLVSALLALDADVIGLSKVANDGYGSESSLADLVSALNASTSGNTYTFSGGTASWGLDEVAVAIIYRSTVVPIGRPALLDTGAFSQATDSLLHRAPMAQAFEEKIWGERFVVVVNEWHDRDNCPADGADADAGDGQACWNAARIDAAKDLAAWLANDPTGSGDPDVLILGELNAFPSEDPLRWLTSSCQYTDLLQQYMGPDVVTTLANGRTGATDHALASAGLDSQIAATSAWNINAEEPAVLDYQLENKSGPQQASLYAPDAYRSSDQNPVAVDLTLIPDQGNFDGDYGVAWHTGQGVWRLGQAWGGLDDGVTQGTGSWNDGQGEITVTMRGPEGGYACLYGWLDYSDGDVQPGVVDAADGDWDANEEVIAGEPLTPGEAQPVTFPLPAGAVKNGAQLNMRLRLIPAPRPHDPDCAPAVQAVAPYAGLAPTGRADGGEVEDIIITTSPLAVALTSFATWIRGAETLISWDTTSEEDAAGFNLYRQGPNSAWIRLNQVTIAARTPGAAQGNPYAWTDRSVPPSVENIYWLEELGLDGSSTYYGPSAGVGTPDAGGPDAVTVTEVQGRGDYSSLAGAVILGLLVLTGLVLLKPALR